MIDFDIHYTNKQIGGLNFQIVSVTNNLISFQNSMVINENLFALIENCFSDVLKKNTKEHKYYHWGKNFHNEEQVDKIIENLYNKKKNISCLNYPWLDKDEISFIKKILINLLIL